MSWLKQIKNHPVVGHGLRYALPFFATFTALFSQGILQQFIPVKADFPYAFFYLIAAFASAWYGGYLPGAIACLITLVGLPFASAHFSQMPPINISRLTLFLGVSLLISRVSQMQKRAQVVLRRDNDELDRLVQARTFELDRAVAELRAEISEHRKTETALRESEERVAFALDGAAIGRWDLDLATGSTDRSLRYDQIFGYDPQPSKWTYDMFLEHVVPEDRAHVAERFATSIRNKSICEFECRINRPDQSVRWIWGRGKIRGQESGGSVTMLGIVRDITDRKVDEQKLRTQIERLHLLDQITRAIGERQDLRSIFQVVVRSLEDNLQIDFGCVCLYDPGLSNLTVTCVGTRNEALAMEMAMTEHSRIVVNQNGLSRCMRGELVYEPDTRELDFPFPQRLSKAGLRSMVAAPLRTDSGVLGMLLASRSQPESFTSADCEFLRQLSQHVALASQQAEIYGALQQAYDDLRQTQQAVQEQERLRALGQMASGIAHDINNALSPVALYTESLLDREPNLSARAREYLETIQRAVEDVAHTVGRMREFYRRREPQLILKPVDINRLVQEVLELSRARWSDMPQQRGSVVQVRTELAPELPPFAGIDSEVREALLNLIFNAVDAMPDGGTLTLRTAATGGPGFARSLSVEVQDTGVGMNEETRRRCFEPFFTTKGERGTGLGLAMVYGIAQRMNAELEIESTAGKGTIARMTFPAAIPATEESQQVYRSAAPPLLRILVVDDDPLIIKSLRNILEGDGHTITVAHGGQEGIDLWRTAVNECGEQFDLVITDLGMPYVDGRKVATAVKTLRPATPVILLTGWGQRMEAEQDIPPHVDRVLNKPPKLVELRAVLADLTSKSHATKAG